MKRALFALALLAYPRAFRRRFGAEMSDDFRRRPLGTARHVRTLVSLATNGLAERRVAIVRWAWFSNATPHLYAVDRQASHVFRNASRRHSIHASSRSQDAGLHCADGARARARHRRHHRHLRRHQRRSAARAAIPRRRAARERLESEHGPEPAAQDDLAGELSRLPEDEHDARWPRGLFHDRHADAAADATAAPKCVFALSVTSNLFSLLGRSAATGRTLRVRRRGARSSC